MFYIIGLKTDLPDSLKYERFAACRPGIYQYQSDGNTNNEYINDFQ
jgi:hypothetical protein